MVYSLRTLSFSLIFLQFKCYSKYLLYAELLVNKCTYFPHYIAYKSLRLIVSTLREWFLLSSVNFGPNARKKKRLNSFFSNNRSCALASNTFCLWHVLFFGLQIFIEGSNFLLLEKLMGGLLVSRHILLG